MNKSVYLRGWVGFLGYECAQNLSTCNILSHLGVMGGEGICEGSHIPPRPFGHPGSSGVNQTNQKCYTMFLAVFTNFSFVGSHIGFRSYICLGN